MDNNAGMKEKELDIFTNLRTSSRTKLLSWQISIQDERVCLWTSFVRSAYYIYDI